MGNSNIVVILISLLIMISIVTCWSTNKAKQSTYIAEAMIPIPSRKKGIYERIIKRGIDIVCAVSAMVCLSPLFLLVGLLVRLKLGSPILFTQERPGLIGKNGRETVFKLYKFRTMTNERDRNGKLLPDEDRLTSFGKWLRRTSLDELPELFNILNGTMSVIGPRPQLVRDMVFMTPEQRVRHTAKPGLSGLAQINGRNEIDWIDKFKWDIVYIDRISLREDIRIVFMTIYKAFIKREGINQVNMATVEDFGDYLLMTGKINARTYSEKQLQAQDIQKNRVVEK